MSYDRIPKNVFLREGPTFGTDFFNPSSYSRSWLPEIGRLRQKKKKHGYFGTSSKNLYLLWNLFLKLSL